MSTRRGYDPWRDAHGAHIPVGARVKQVAIHKDHGALAGRLGKAAEVVAHGRGSRLHVRFDDEDQVVTIRPYLVALLPILTLHQVGARIRALHELVDVKVAAR